MSHSNVSIESLFSSLVCQWGEKLLPYMLKCNHNYVNASGKCQDPLTQAYICLLALCSGCPLFAADLHSYCAKAARLSWTPTRMCFQWGDLILRAQQVEGCLNPNLPECTVRHSQPSWFMGLTGEKQPDAEWQSCLCCCPKGFLHGYLSLVKACVLSNS